MSTLSRLDVVKHLPNEHGRPLALLPWWREGLSKLDDPSVQELLLWLQRQSGKSQFCAAAAISELLTVRNSYIVYVSASVDQAEAVYTRKVRRPLEKLARTLGLANSLRFTRRGVQSAENGAMLELLAPNEGTVPGRTISLLVIDEGRYVSDETYTSLAPSVIGAGGKLLIASTAGQPSGFFYQLVSNPTPQTWLYHSLENENPEAARRPGVLDFIRRRLGLVSATAARRELDNEFAESGDELIAWPLIERAIDDSIGEHAGRSSAQAFAAFDLSRRRDLTSCVVVVREAARRPEATDHLVVRSISTWDPKASATGEVDFASVRADLASLPARFPGLVKVLVDEGAEGGSLLPFAREHPKLSLLVEGFNATANSNMEIWGALVARFHAGTIAIPRHDRLLAELRSVRRESFAFGSRWRVVDSSRQFHRDVSFSLALATWAAGSTFRCVCGDASCDGKVPWAVGNSPAVLDWWAAHPHLWDDEQRADAAREQDREIDRADKMIPILKNLFECGCERDAAGATADVEAIARELRGLLAVAPGSQRTRLEGLVNEWVRKAAEARDGV